MRRRGKAQCASPTLLFPRITLLELLDASARLNVALTPREERMALRADVDAQILLRRAGRERIAAAARHRRLEELGMNSLFHVNTPRFFCRIQARLCTLG